MIFVDAPWAVPRQKTIPYTLKRLACCLTLTAWCLLPGLASGDIYTWVDRDGVTHFQNREPTNIESSIQVEIIPSREGMRAYAQPECGLDFYDIQGETPEELWKQMMARGRRLGDKTAIGWTTCSIKCHIGIDRRNGRYVVSSATAIADIKITLPRWPGVRLASGDMQWKWERFYNAVKTHEEWHKNDFTRCVPEVENAIAALPPLESQEKLVAAAQAASKNVQDLYEKRGQEFDARPENRQIRELLR